MIHLTTRERSVGKPCEGAGGAAREASCWLPGAVIKAVEQCSGMGSCTGSNGLFCLAI